MVGHSYQRPPGRDGIRGLKEVYPNRYAKGRKLKDPPNVGTSRNIRGAEKHGVSCFQCGYPIQDTRIINTCPNCSSDNFKGEHVTL